MSKDDEVTRHIHSVFDPRQTPHGQEAGSSDVVNSIEHKIALGLKIAFTIHGDGGVHGQIADQNHFQVPLNGESSSKLHAGARNQPHITTGLKIPRQTNSSRGRDGKFRRRHLPVNLNRTPPVDGQFDGDADVLSQIDGSLAGHLQASGDVDFPHHNRPRPGHYLGVTPTDIGAGQNKIAPGIDQA